MNSGDHCSTRFDPRGVAYRYSDDHHPLRSLAPGALKDALHCQEHRMHEPAADLAFRLGRVLAILHMPWYRIGSHAIRAPLVSGCT